MSILLHRGTRALVQGLTGREGAFHGSAMRSYGTELVAGVTPGKGGTEHEGLPVFDTVAEARAATGATATILFVPPAVAADGIAEAIDAGMELIVCTADGIPVHDMLRVRRLLVRQSRRGGGPVLIGPNCPGLISPGQAKLGFMPDSSHRPGPVGVTSRSGSLAYEVCLLLTRAGLGQSTVVGVGGDVVKGADFTDLLPLFEDDPDTAAVVMLCEVGGDDEERAARWLVERGRGKPVVAYVAGKSAPAGERMGHPGTQLCSGGDYARKLAVLRSAGALVAETPWHIPDLVRDAMDERG